MKIVEPWIEVEDFNGEKIMKNIERACRTCYRSENLINEESYKTLLRNCLNRGHESILEHEKISVRIFSDIGTYKDLTRHRFASFSIESTRYCNYGKDKFDNEIKFIKPCNIENSNVYTCWENCMEDIERHYLKASSLGATPDELRLMLPHATAAEYVMTCNIREWRHVLDLRTKKMSHPSIRQVLIPLLLLFKQEMPELFDGIEYDIDFPPEKCAKITVKNDEQN